MKKFVRYSNDGIVNIENITRVYSGSKDHVWFFVIGSSESTTVDSSYVESFMSTIESYT